MAIVKTKISGESIDAGLGKKQAYSLTLDDSWLAAGKPVDFSDDFSLIYEISIGGTTAINANRFGFILPAQGTAISASNVLMTAHAGANVAVVDTTDLTGVGAVQVIVTGKPAVEV